MEFREQGVKKKPGKPRKPKASEGAGRGTHVKRKDVVDVKKISKDFVEESEKIEKFQQTHEMESEIGKKMQQLDLSESEVNYLSDTSDIMLDACKEIEKWKVKVKSKKLQKSSGTFGNQVQLLTNRVQILNIPRMISIFHFKFSDDEGKDSKQKVDLKQFIQFENEPLAYDGSKIIVQYGFSSEFIDMNKGKSLKNAKVSEDEFVLHALKKPLEEFSKRFKFEVRENRELDVTGQDLAAVDWQYLEIIFAKNLPKATLKDLRPQDSSGSRGGRGGSRGRGGRGGFSGGGGPDKDASTLDIQYKYRSSLISTESGPQVALDVSGSICYKKMPLMEHLEKSGFYDSAAGRFVKDMKFVARDIVGLKIRPTNRPNAVTSTIKSFSDEPCGRLKTDEIEGKVYTVAEYFRKTYNLNVNGNLPCVRTSTKKRIFYPLEVCEVVSEQKFRKELPRSAFKDVHLPPFVRLDKIKQGLQQTQAAVQRSSNNDFKISADVLKVPGREIGTIMANQKSRFADPKTIKSWAVVNGDSKMLSEGDIQAVVSSFVSVGTKYGMTISSNPKWFLFRGDFSILDKTISELDFVYFIKPENDKTSYKMAKEYSWVKTGVPLQCSLSKHFRNASQNARGLESYFRNLLLKVNLKLGGYNFTYQKPNKFLTKQTLILGLDICQGMLNVTDGDMENSNKATVSLVSSSLMTSAFRSQSARTNVVNPEVLKQLLEETVPNKERFSSVVIYRDGVSESLFNKVDSVEVSTLKTFFGKAKLTFVVLQKNHKTKLFKLVDGKIDNPIAGTVVDKVITDKLDFDFYLQAHKCGIGTARIPHYRILHDDNNFSADDIQVLTNDLSCLYQRSFGAVSQTCASYYAHILAEKCRLLMDKEGKMPSLHPKLKKQSGFFFL